MHYRDDAGLYQLSYFVLSVHNDLVAYLRTECNNNNGIFVTNDIESLLALMFADDVSCFSDTVIRLQKMIDLIGQFCKSVGMEINLKKQKLWSSGMVVSLSKQRDGCTKVRK